MSAEQFIVEIAEKAQRYFSVGIISAFGGIACYLYEHVKGEREFSFITMLIMIFLAFFVGSVLGEMLPHDMKGRDGILMVAGFSSWPILDVMRARGKKIADAIFNRFMKIFE